MIPAPNFIAGVLIGIANEQLYSVALSSLGWGLFFCFYVSVVQSKKRKETISTLAERGQRLFLNSPAITFLLIEFITSFFTSIVVGSIVFGVKQLFC